MWMGEAIALSLRTLIEILCPALCQQNTRKLRHLKYMAWTSCANPSALRASLHQSHISLPHQLRELLKRPMSLPGLHGEIGLTPNPWHMVMHWI